jgi:hypothetical protein
MTQQAPSNPLPAVLLRARDGLILHQTLYAGWVTVPSIWCRSRVGGLVWTGAAMDR